tara:strand:- start:990 stop:1274 length:285 start_codon:yes stop_codon:yes gene_type:complete
MFIIFIVFIVRRFAMTKAEMERAIKTLTKELSKAKGSTSKKRVIDFELSEYKGKDRLLVYPNGKNEDKFSKWISLDAETVKAILNSEICEDFAS